jgi:ribosomal protein S27AE
VTDHFVKLKCENCGSGFDVYDDMDRFACGYCGTEMAVQRRGGTIVLHPVADAVRKTPLITDNPPRELALGHLKEEADTLSKRCESMLSDRAEQKKRGFIIGASLLLVGFVVVRTGFSFMGGLAMLLAGIFTISYVRRHDKTVMRNVQELQNKLDVLNGRIQDHG